MFNVEMLSVDTSGLDEDAFPVDQDVTATIAFRVMRSLSETRLDLNAQDIGETLRTMDDAERDVLRERLRDLRSERLALMDEVEAELDERLADLRARREHLLG